MSRRPVKVVIVEDSVVQRAHLRRVLEAGHTIAVIGEAADADGAVDTVSRLHPDVVTMDLHIPGGGVDAISRIMASAPAPILVLSVAVQKAESTLAFDAMAAGAVDALPKPARWNPSVEGQLRERVAALRSVRPVRTPVRGRPAGTVERGDGIIGIAASTGGPPAVVQVLGGLSGAKVPIVVVQHLPAEFTESFAAWLGRSVSLKVVLARDGDRLEPGTVYVGRAGAHVRVRRTGSEYRVASSPSPATLHRPSADELFASMAKAVGRAGVGVLLTGMGDDGATGLLALKDSGGTTIVQDEATSAVFGMPKAAIAIGAATEVRPVGEIAAAAVTALAKGRT